MLSHVILPTEHFVPCFFENGPFAISPFHVRGEVVFESFQFATPSSCCIFSSCSCSCWFTAARQSTRSFDTCLFVRWLSINGSTGSVVGLLQWIAWPAA